MTELFILETLKLFLGVQFPLGKTTLESVLSPGYVDASFLPPALIKDTDTLLGIAFITILPVIFLPLQLMVCFDALGVMVCPAIVASVPVSLLPLTHAVLPVKISPAAAVALVCEARVLAVTFPLPL